MSSLFNKIISNISHFIKCFTSSHVYVCVGGRTGWTGCSGVLHVLRMFKTTSWSCYGLFLEIILLSFKMFSSEIFHSLCSEKNFTPHWCSTSCPWWSGWKKFSQFQSLSKQTSNFFKATICCLFSKMNKKSK